MHDAARLLTLKTRVSISCAAAVCAHALLEPRGVGYVPMLRCCWLGFFFHRRRCVNCKDCKSEKRLTGADTKSATSALILQRTRGVAAAQQRWRGGVRARLTC